jgi:hypothetical protein
MVTTCRGMAAGMLLTVKSGDRTSKAELARANEDLDICTLTVKGAGPGVKIRTGMPSSREQIQAVLVNAEGQPEARQVSVARSIKDAKAAALELRAAVPLPNGTPAFDSQARLVGIVVRPHAFGDGLVVALGTARIAQARGGAASREAVADATVPASTATSPAPTQTPAQASAPPEAAATPPGESAAPLPVPAPRRAPRGTIVDQGFATLWKEDEGLRLIEVLDHPKVGTIGDPITFWTLWKGRDANSNPQTHCLVTFGDDEEVVADFDQTPGIPSADGYWYCGLTRFQVDLADLPVGEYHFTIFVNGQNVAEASTRIEKKFWTRDKYAIIVVVLGLLVLSYVRSRRKPAG